MFAHVHGTGRFYGSRGGNWIKLRDEATTLVNADISGTTNCTIKTFFINYKFREVGPAAIDQQN